ncbi:SpoIIE family protein phosphatase [Flavobacterium sp.]|uniref:SpoIIE family protein phosphatase n=1 Tax=Flavobacterium sp. TaxID=239 RepID=UPI004033E7EE
MDNAAFTSYKIEDKSYVSFIKREIHNLATAKGYSSQKTGEIDIIISELTSNLTKFVGEGELLYRAASDRNGDFFEMYCLDDGQGITNLNRMLQDGESSAKTLGQGLGAVHRLSSESSVYTLKGWGTVVYSKIYKEGPKISKNKSPVEVTGIKVNMPGELVCGDGFLVKEIYGGYMFFLCDGLGHGEYASEAANEAIDAFRICREKSPAELLKFIHLQVKKTRGLVGTVAFLDLNEKKWRICGIGNISTSVITGLEGKNYTPYNGIIGMNIPRTLNDSVVDLQKYQTLIMHSDGLKNRWNINSLPGLMKHPPGIIASCLFKDNARRTDDMSVLAAKINI